jgi:hypothetical protein
MTRKADLDRHIRSKHNSAQSYFCPVTSCKRSRHGDKGFARKEHLDAHYRRLHPFLRHSGRIGNSASLGSIDSDADGISDLSNQDAVQQQPPWSQNAQDPTRPGQDSPPHVRSADVEKHQVGASVTTYGREIGEIKENIASLELQIAALRQSMLCSLAKA